PGVEHRGINSTTWTDHTNVRPTILALTGLKDDYESDGHPLVSAMTSDAKPATLRSTIVPKLEQVEDLLNAPVGTFVLSTLAASTFALESTNDDTYNSIEDQISSLTDQRNVLATKIKDELYNAAIGRRPINTEKAQAQITKAQQLIAQAGNLQNN